MKRSAFTTPRFVFHLYTAIICVVLWALWFFRYRFFMIWLEGFSYFSYLPDFKSLYGILEDGFFKYVGAFFLQFYKWPAIGALLQTFFAVWPAFCLGTVIIRLFRDPEKLMWLSYLYLPAFVYYQFWDLTLVHSIAGFFCSGLFACLVTLVTMGRKPQWKVPKIIGNRLVMALVPLAALFCSLYFLIWFDDRMIEHERTAELEYYAEKGEWNKILNTVSLKDAKGNEFKMRYALLALSETGRLPDYAFSYGLKGSSDFLFYGREEPLCLAYNSLFYKALGMPNAVIHQTYQQSMQSLPGMCFGTLRRLADTYLELKDYTLAKKYLNILGKSTCHHKWVNDRLGKLESIRGKAPLYIEEDNRFIIGSYLPTVSAMVDRNPENKKYADLLLCGILADSQGSIFYEAFKIISYYLYPDGKNIPRLYQEALLIIASYEPEILEKYEISEEVRKGFSDFTQLIQNGRNSVAKKKYADTYWAYIY